MPRDTQKGHEALRRGRVSVSGAEYFLTICTEERQVGVTAPRVAELLIAEMRAMDADATWRLRCAVVMPDHVHVLFELGARLTLGKSVARLKAKSAASLRATSQGLGWQRDFFDHHVRPDDDRLSLFLYIYLNPFRSGLSRRLERWPWYFCRDEDWTWFKDHLENERPFPEWLM